MKSDELSMSEMKYFWQNLSKGWSPSKLSDLSSIHTSHEYKDMYNQAEACMRKRIDNVKRLFPDLEKTYNKAYPISNRHFDIMAEQEVAKFLDKYLYPRITSNTPFAFQRETERDKQLKGVDVTLTILRINNNSKIYIDEKAAVHYINSPLSSFAFECSFDRYENDILIHTTGWFSNEKLLTNIYLLIYISIDERIAPPQEGSNEYYKTLEADDITCAHCLFISRNNLKIYLTRHGFGYYEIKEAIQKIRNGVSTDKLTSPNERFHFHYSTNLKEKPINIILDKSLLEELSPWIIDVRPSGNTILKGTK